MQAKTNEVESIPQYAKLMVFLCHDVVDAGCYLINKGAGRQQHRPRLQMSSG